MKRILLLLMIGFSLSASAAHPETANKQSKHGPFHCFVLLIKKIKSPTTHSDVRLFQ